MLALSDTQDLTSLRFGGGIDLGCAERILEIIKAVKRQPVEFLCLLLDIIGVEKWSSSSTNPAVLLESIKQAMAIPDDESISYFLRPMALELQIMLQWGKPLRRDSGILRETERISHLLQAKYARSFISSSSQLQSVSCALSGVVVQPAMGWLRMHEPL
jgi:hypothetical protein